MGLLDVKQRKALPKKDFGLPAQRKYPMENKSHAANAKARAKQQYNRGDLSKSSLEEIDAKANAKLRKSK